MEYAGIGALVDSLGERQIFFRRVLGTRNFSGQITQLLTAGRLPDLILISIGHNNVDWAWRCPPAELKQPNKRLQRQGRDFGENFARQLHRLIKRARMQPRRVAIVVYGLVNFESYFKARERAERLRAEDRRLYPHLETTYKYFPSFRPQYRHHLTRLATMVNEQLRIMVGELSCELSPNCNLQVRYSDALARADLNRIDLLHTVDGWHASIAGHNVLAEAAFNDLGPSLEFLGIKSAPSDSQNQTQDRHL
jgi:lysophospholipase L1-like esterase